MSIYDVLGWINDSPPPINASNLGHLEKGVYDAHVELASQAVQLGSTIAYASTLYSNIGANASAIAAHATHLYLHDNAIASLLADDVVQDAAIAAQAAAIASNTSAVASMLPDVASHTIEIADLYGQVASGAGNISGLLATQGAHSSQISTILATQGAEASQIAALQASAANNYLLDQAQASQLAFMSSQIAGIGVGAAGLTDNQSTLNRSGNGPVDLWSPTVEPVGVTATAGVARAIALRYNPVATIGHPASGIVGFDAWLLPNAGVPSPLGTWAMALLDGLTGSVMAWSGVRSVPSVPTGVNVQHATAPFQVSAGYLSTPFWLSPEKDYYLMVASTDEFRLGMLGQAAHGAAAGDARYQLGLAYEYALPSGLGLASYGSFRLPVQSIPTITSPVPSPVAPGAYPAVFLT